MPEDQVKNRAAVYIDGYNLYYPVHELGEPFLKWCDLWRLSELICAPKKLALHKVVFCTAVPQHDPEKRDFHNTFNNAIAARGVEILKGHHVYDEERGKYSEKQSDINVALSLIIDGLEDLFDWAFLISADSDQAATARFFKLKLPHKKFVVVAPPGRRPPQKSLPYCDLHFSLSKQQIEACVMPPYVPGRKGLIRRPAGYAPPEGWVHPDHRPGPGPKPRR